MPPPPFPPSVPLDVDALVGDILDDVTNMLNDSLGAGVTGGTAIDPGAYQQIVDVPGAPINAQDLKHRVVDGFRLAFAALLKRMVDGGMIGGAPVSVPPTFNGTCTAGEIVGDIVYVEDVNRDVRKADIDDTSKVSAVGIIIQKPTATTCVVQVSGLVSVYTGLTPDARYFIGANSRPTATRPTGSELSPKMVVTIGHAIDTNLFLLRPTTVVRTRS